MNLVGPPAPILPQWEEECAQQWDVYTLDDKVNLYYVYINSDTYVHSFITKEVFI